MVKIEWKLGDRSGIEICATDKEVTRFSTSLMDEKLSLIGERVTTLRRFENLVYRYGAMSYRKRKKYANEIESLQQRIKTLQDTPLRVTISRQ